MITPWGSWRQDCRCAAGLVPTLLLLGSFANSARGPRRASPGLQPPRWPASCAPCRRRPAVTSSGARAGRRRLEPTVRHHLSGWPQSCGTVAGEPSNPAVLKDSRIICSVLFGSRRPPATGAGNATKVSASVDGLAASCRWRSIAIAQDGSSKIRWPAADFVDGLMMSPPCRSRRTVPWMSTVPASRSMSDQRTARASPIRSPVARRKDTRSGRSRATERGSWDSQRVSRLTSSTVRAVGRLRGLAEMRATSRQGLWARAS
ncbi:hypothetical protein SAMN04488543_3853 [Friedmanniella luteola]|uniref:Uncharacterized protein n=1 Tax=Friedmanniella luteola TaxID=546871 RepID=A0A1H1ZLL6_9ACTN|nr:hypothetical protein SAMN04488543_3853 [Friedmanniella luteola]